MKLLVINGPNLNFLGIREKGIYGTQDYNFLLNMIQNKAEETGCEIECFQSNHEGAIIDRIQESYFDGTEGIPFPRWKSTFQTLCSGRSFGTFLSQGRCVTTRFTDRGWTDI